MLELAASEGAKVSDCRLYGDDGVTRRRGGERSVRSSMGAHEAIVIRVLTEEAQRVVRACDAHGDTRLQGFLSMVEGTLRGDRAERAPVDVLVQIFAETLEGAGGEGGISAVTARRLLCDAGIVAATVDAEGPTGKLGRKRRTISPAMRRARGLRDGGCRFPGCSHRRWLDGHHVEHWAHGGAT